MLKQKHPIERLISRFVIPILITGFFFFYTLYSEPLDTAAGRVIWSLQWMLAVFIGPFLLILELIDGSTGPEINLGSGTWMFKIILKIYYYGMASLLLIVLFAEWWLG